MKPGQQVIFYSYKTASTAPKKIPAIVVKVDGDKVHILPHGSMKPRWVLIENVVKA